MIDIADLTGSGDAAPARRTPQVQLSRPEKAAIVLGILGAEAATPLLEQMDENCHRSFANAMARLERIDPEVAQAVIAEFLSELETSDMTITGGIVRARELLQDFMDEKALERILDEADRPNQRNVWEKLVKVDDATLAEYLMRENPQTAAVIVNRLAPDRAAAILARLPSEITSRIILGLERAGGLSANVIEAIGQSVSRDFLARQPRGKRHAPADRIGAIMNYAAGEMRQSVLDFLGRANPGLLAEVRRKMFTFEDIPARIERRDVTAIIRATPNEVLLPALAGAAENAPDTREFILANISSRIAEQVREELAELGTVKLRAAEEAQTEIIKTIRSLEAGGTLKLIDIED